MEDLADTYLGRLVRDTSTARATDFVRPHLLRAGHAVRIPYRRGQSLKLQNPRSGRVYILEKINKYMFARLHVACHEWESFPICISYLE